MELPEKILLSKIKKTNLYFDKKSLEKPTNKIKPKYKLARNKLLEIYPFNILTKNKSACKKKLTLTIENVDWEYKIEGYLKEKYSYCDVTKCDILDEAELIAKIRDKNNTFPYVAKLCDKKYEKLEALCEKAMHIPYISKPVKDIIKLTLSDIADDKIKELALD